MIELGLDAGTIHLNYGIPYTIDQPSRRQKLDVKESLRLLEGPKVG